MWHIIKTLLAIQLVAVHISTNAYNSSREVIAQRCHEYTFYHCGRERIIGGFASAVEQFPYLIHLVIMPGTIIEFYCGGTLVSDKFVVTAAHCVVYSEVRQPQIWAYPGLYRKSERWMTRHYRVVSTAYPRDFQPASLMGETQKNASTIDYDIAVLQLEESVPFSRRVYPSCIYTGDSRRLRFGRTVGWGRTEYQEFPDAPSWVDLAIIPDCGSATYLCAGRRTKGGCYGDSGGPFVGSVGCQIFLVALVSHGSVECNRYGTFTDVSKFYKFIASVVWGTSDMPEIPYLVHSNPP